MSDTAAQPAAQPAKKKSRKLLFIAAALVALLAAGGGGFFYFTRAAAAKPEHAKKSKATDRDAEDESAAAEHGDEEHGDEEHAGAGHGGAANKSGKTDKKRLRSLLPKDEAVKHVIELQPFIVNLADTDAPRYLRMSVSIGTGGEEGGEEKPDPIFTTRVRNAMLAVLTTKSSAEILSVEGKAALRRELLEIARASAEEPPIHAIYITEFIVQL